MNTDAETEAVEDRHNRKELGAVVKLTACDFSYLTAESVEVEV